MLERSVSVEGVRVEWYRNKAYTCSRRGYQTFLVAYPEGVPPNRPLPLWIRLHGGGVGAYGPGGQYLPSRYCSGQGSPCYIDEESLETLGNYLRETGLVQSIREMGTSRFLVPSMCDHDLYMGLGIVDDPYNPNIDANGQRPRADGYLALRSALEFTRQRYATTHIFAHGTSAGSVGALNLAAMLALEGTWISGVIADSGAVSDLSPLLAQAGCAAEYDPQVVELAARKLGFVVAVDQLVRAGTVRTPIYNFFNTHDRVFACQPVDQVTITDPAGNSYRGSGMQLAYLRVNEALRASPLMAVSRIHEVCVGRDPQRGECFVHIPTIRASSQVGGDRYRGGEDYNAVIVAWVRERLGDPRPPLATSP